MKNHLSDVRIAEYVEALSFNKEKSFDTAELEHLENCALCREKVLDLSMFFTEEADTKQEVTLKEEYIYETVSRYNKEKTPYSRIFSKIAAAFVVTISMYYAWMIAPEMDFLREDKAQVPAEIVKTEKPGSVTDKKRRAVKRKVRPVRKKAVKSVRDAFALNSNLERMVGNTYRGGSIKIVTPDDGSNFEKDSKIEFKWSGIKPDNHSLKIVNNLNETVYEFNVQDNYIQVDSKLSKGLYYWKLENETDLVHVGRFYVK